MITQEQKQEMHKLAVQHEKFFQMAKAKVLDIEQMLTDIRFHVDVSLARDAKTGVAIGWTKNEGKWAFYLVQANGQFERLVETRSWLVAFYENLQDNLGEELVKAARSSVERLQKVAQ